MAETIAPRPFGISQTTEETMVAPSDFWGIFSLFIWGRRSKGGLALALLTILVSSSATMTAAWCLGKLVETLSTGSPSVYWFAAGFVGLEVVAVTLQYFGRIRLAFITTQIITDIRSDLFTKSIQLPISYFDTQPLGRILTRLTSDVEGIETFFSGTLARILIAMIQIGSVITAMLILSPMFGLMIAASCLPSLWISWMTRKPARQFLRVYRRRSAHLNARLAEFLNGIAVIKYFGLEDWSQKIFRADSHALLAAGIDNLNLNSVIRPIVVLFCTIPTLTVLWVGGHQVIDGTLQIGMLVSFVRLCERFMSPVRTISQEVQLVQEAMVSSERVKHMLGEQTEAQQLGPTGGVSRSIQGRIEFKDVCMSYQTGAQVLNGVSFAAGSGQKIALVGQTGSGKTTMVNLIPRFYDYSHGHIFIDGIELKDWDRDRLREQLGYVTQDVVIFRGTFRDNLLAACPASQKTSDDQIIAACQETGLLRVIRKSPRGLDTMILDEGNNLSMGERQLVSFTRMLLKEPRILILDEATANVDERHERIIQDAMARLLKGRTCFIVAHRLSTVVDADLILVFGKGIIQAQGNHASLMQHSQYYRELVKNQLSKTNLVDAHDGIKGAVESVVIS